MLNGGSAALGWAAWLLTEVLRQRCHFNCRVGVLLLSLLNCHEFALSMSRSTYHQHDVGIDLGPLRRWSGEASVMYLRRAVFLRFLI